MMNDKHIPVCKGGGLYHSHKVEYTKETKELVKGLLNESKLSIKQRNLLNDIVRNGDPLPKLSSVIDKNFSVKKLQSKPTSSKRRSIDTIKRSGAYEREMYSPANNKVNRETEKKRLQSLMAYGKDLKIMPDELTVKSGNINSASYASPSREISNSEVFDELLLEIEERVQFLEDMELLGEGKKHKPVIENEIFAKMRQLKLLDKYRYENEKGVVEEYRNKNSVL